MASLERLDISQPRCVSNLASMLALAICEKVWDKKPNTSRGYFVPKFAYSTQLRHRRWWVIVSVKFTIRSRTREHVVCLVRQSAGDVRI